MRTWVVLGCLILGTTWFCASHAYDYLAPVEPAVGARVLVVEAGPSLEAVHYVKGLLDTGRYSRIVPVSMPIDPLSPFAHFGTDADLWAARLVRLGVPPERVEVVRVPALDRHRTAHKALAVRRHLDVRAAAAVDLVSPSTHARRSLLVYERALRPTRVGVLSIPQPDADRQWWNSSAGVRMVIGEALALGYFCVGRDEVEQARTDWAKLSSGSRQGE